MSINAEIVSAKLNEDGTVNLHLGPIKNDPPGQRMLIVENPPSDTAAFMSAIIGQQIWGSSGSIMVRDTKWADRIGYTRIRLVG
jgi:hypothetical protein